MNFFGFFLCFLTTKGIPGERIAFSLDIVFSCNKRMQNVTKIVWLDVVLGDLQMCVGKDDKVEGIDTYTMI